MRGPPPPTRTRARALCQRALTCDGPGGGGGGGARSSILPVRRQILTGLLHCDLIGFHTYDYARHFLSSCTRILSLQTAPNGVEYEGRFVEVGTFPVGIEPDKFAKVRVRGLWSACARPRVHALLACARVHALVHTRAARPALPPPPAQRGRS